LCAGDQLDLPKGVNNKAFRRRLLDALEENAPWGLSSLDSSSLPLDNVYRYANNGERRHAGRGLCDA
jgi:hypothetical protein